MFGTFPVPHAALLFALASETLSRLALPPLPHRDMRQLSLLTFSLMPPKPRFRAPHASLIRLPNGISRQLSAPTIAPHRLPLKGETGPVGLFRGTVLRCSHS